MVGFREAKVDEYVERMVTTLNVGGVILFDVDVPSESKERNIIDEVQLKKLIFDLQAISKTPLFVSVNAEGGLINRLKRFIAMPSHKELGGTGDIWNVRANALNLAKELKEFGFNMNFAPVVDIDLNPNNPVIGKLERSFSNDYYLVAEFAKAFIKAQKEEGIISVVKHFPGHGSSENDSHLGITDVTNTYQKEELYPYQVLNEESFLDAVMTAHIINKNIDRTYPATLSQNHINILRDIIGFKGVIISDDMQMKAISDNFGLKESIIKSINAGCNIILISNNVNIYDPNLPYKVYQIIVDAIENKDISKERIRESLFKIETLKRAYFMVK